VVGTIVNNSTLVGVGVVGFELVGSEEVGSDVVGSVEDG
jgi:hypothetical protein